MGKYNLGGRPVKFKTPDDMLDKMHEYLAYCEDREVTKIVKSGVVTAKIQAPITVEGFCAFAGITKTTFYEYKKKPKFDVIVCQFTQIVESYWVDQCAEGMPGNKADFILKNAFSDFWKDKTTNELDLAEDLKKSMVCFVGVDGNEITASPSEGGGQVQASPMPE